MKIGNKIGSGNFRDCFEILDNNEIYLKRVKPFSFTISSLISGILDLNLIEKRIRDFLPNDIKKYIVKMDFCEEGLIVEKIVDYDGKNSKTLKEYGKISDENFWNIIYNIYNKLYSENIWLLDVLSGGNIIVQRKNKNEIIPILIDVKRYGWLSFPLQFNLITKSGKRKKIERKYRKLLLKYKS